jgi:large subunit ribosomal protein L32
MHSVTRRVARTLGACARAPPPSTARWTRVFTLGSLGSVVGGDGIGRPTARLPTASARCVPEFCVPEHVWGDTTADGTPGHPFALMAVPKRKVTPSRRKRRNQFKRIDFVTDVQRCRDCGKAKRPHVYCDQCSTNIYDDMRVGGGRPSSGSVVP